MCAHIVVPLSVFWDCSVRIGNVFKGIYVCRLLIVFLKYIIDCITIFRYHALRLSIEKKIIKIQCTPSQVDWINCYLCWKQRFTVQFIPFSVMINGITKIRIKIAIEYIIYKYMYKKKTWKKKKGTKQKNTDYNEKCVGIIEYI